jgi:hypothetical protein
MFASIGSYKEADNFKNMLIKQLSLGQGSVSEYTAIHNNVTQISTKNIQDIKIIGDIKYFDVFLLLKGCLITAFNQKTIGKMSGKMNA